MHILCEKQELPTSPISLHVLAANSRKEQETPNHHVSSLDRKQTFGQEERNQETTKSILKKEEGLGKSFSGTSHAMTNYGDEQTGHVTFSGLSEPCSVGSIVEVVVGVLGAFKARRLLTYRSNVSPSKAF